LGAEGGLHRNALRTFLSEKTANHLATGAVSDIQGDQIGRMFDYGVSTMDSFFES
jgi:hypothetical protein